VGMFRKKVAVAFAGNDSVPPLRKKRHASLQHQATAVNIKITCSKKRLPECIFSTPIRMFRKK
jgi:hypothetical protein